MSFVNVMDTPSASCCKQTLILVSAYFLALEKKFVNIKKEDLNRGAVSLEQAQNGGFHNYQIPMYLSDGKSIVGYFRIK